MSRRTRTIIIALMLAAVLVPLIPLVLWSFTDIWPFDQPLPSFSLRSWEATLRNSQVIEALINSLVLCVVVVSLSLAMSFFAAKNLGTRRFKGRRLIQFLLLVPSFIPQIALVFGMQRVFSQIGLYNNYAGVVVALLVFYVPYMTLLLSAVFEGYDMDYERQAKSLGVSSWNILWHVTLPAVRSGVIVSCIFNFIGVWAAYLVVSAVAHPTFRTMSLLAFPMISSASNGYAATACVIFLYILPILLILIFFSKLLVTDTDRPDTNQTGGML
ncbi:MAG: ABC transporter permease subunit [Eggerthellaceae bacterium]|nr:ABC transporter permease subunit [Eggerthellaceae bacterium]